MPGPTEASEATTGGAIERWVGSLGRGFLEVAEATGGVSVLLGRVLWRLVRLDFDGREFIRILYRMGVHSLPIVVITALFVGAIMVVQAAPLVERFNAKSLLGWAAGFSTLREIGPLLTALMLSGRIGANNTAELGTMVVTEQIDALRALAIDPVSYLIVPRVTGMVLTFFISTVFSDVLALTGAALVGDVVLQVDPVTFYQGVTGDRLNFGDVAHGLIKSVTFGIIIAATSCHYGLATTGGAPGVGRAVTSSVVVSAIGVFSVDYFMSFLIG